jgi:ABC-type uncharacterized transport system permease subunit
MIELLDGLVSNAVLSGGVLALAALGGLLCERVGILNLGLEGLMALGGVCAIIMVAKVPIALLGVGAALLVGAVFGLAYAVATIAMRADQVLCGLALSIGGAGLAASIGNNYAGQPARAVLEPIIVPGLSELPILGKALFSQNIVVYLIFIFLPLTLHTLLFHTRHGIDVRAVGENPAAADASGVHVTLIRIAYVTVGSALASASGSFLTLASVPSWSEGITGGRGWIAIALIIFAGYQPVRVVLGALLFGLISALGFVGQARNWPIAPALLSMLPYLATLLTVTVPVVLWKGMRRQFSAPAALGLPYYRDER